MNGLQMVSRAKNIRIIALTTLAVISAMPKLAGSELATAAEKVDEPHEVNALRDSSISNALLSTPNRPTDGPFLQRSNANGNPLWSIPVTSLTSTLQRPLFSPSRRPRPVAILTPIQAPPVPPPVVEQPRRPLLSLVGAIAGTVDGIAIFVDETSKNMVRLKTGEGHAGWILRDVESREVTLQNDGYTAVFTLSNPPAK